jgi:hypothetical protein
MKNNGIEVGTRSSNTGLFSQTPPNPPKKGYELSIDWLTLSYPIGGYGESLSIIGLIEKTFSETIDYSPSRAVNRWGQTYRGSSSDSLRGTMLYSNPPKDGNFGELRVYLPGKALATATMNEIRDFCQISSEMFSASCARFDVAIDDYSKVLNLDEVKSAQDKGNFAYVETIGYHESGERGGKDKGRTITFGSRQSESYSRFYDKNVESKGKIDAIRLEGEFKDSKAQQLFEQWTAFAFTDDEQQCAKLLAGAVLGAVRFCDRSSGDKNLDRCEDLPWYKKLCDSVVSGFRLRVRKKERFLDDAVYWVEKAVIPTLSMIRKYMGDDVFLQWVYDCTDEAMPLLSKIKLEKIQQQQQLDQEEQQNRTTTERRTTMREAMFEDGLYWD